MTVKTFEEWKDCLSRLPIDVCPQQKFDVVEQMKNFWFAYAISPGGVVLKEYSLSEPERSDNQNIVGFIRCKSRRVSGKLSPDQIVEELKSYNPEPKYQFFLYQFYRENEDYIVRYATFDPELDRACLLATW